MTVFSSGLFSLLFLLLVSGLARRQLGQRIAPC